MKPITTLCFVALCWSWATLAVANATDLSMAKGTLGYGSLIPVSIDTPNLTCNINYAGLRNVNTLDMVVQVNNFTPTAVPDSSQLVLVKNGSGQTFLQVIVPPIPAGGHHSLSLSALLSPNDLLPGTFSISAYADYDNKVLESNDFDNSAQYSIDIPSGLNLPDLELRVLSPPSLSGDILETTFEIQNIGGGIMPASSALLALHPDSAYNWYTGLPLNTVAVPALNTGQVYGFAQAAQLPPAMRSGRFFLEISAGSDLNYENNRRLIPFDNHSLFVSPNHVLLGEGKAVAVRQNNDQSYTVLVKTPDEKARAVRVSSQGTVTGMTDIGSWGQQTKFVEKDAFVSIRGALPGFYLTKTSLQGVPLWSKYFSPLSGEVVSGVSSANDGGFVICGAITIPNATGPSSQKPFLLRTDSLGNELWRRTTGPAASALVDIVNLPNGTFGAISNALGYIEQKFGFEIFRISAEGTQFTTVDAILRSYQGTFSMQASGLRAGTDSTLYYVSNLADFGKWTVNTYATYGKTNGWKTINTACRGVCGGGNSYTAAFATIPTNDGGGLAAGANYSDFNDFDLARLDAQGKVLWRRPYPKNVSDGLQNASGNFALCGNMGTQAYLSFIGADGNPVLGDVACLNDQTAPILEACPDNITVKTPENSASVNWTPPAAADNCGLAAVQSNVQPGSFGVGEHEIVFTATDQSGNTDACRFTVSVVNIPCLPVNYFTYCSDNLTPDNHLDDSLHLIIHVLSPTPGQWKGTLQDVPGAAPFIGDFNADAHLVFPLQYVSPYILDKQMVVTVEGLNGNSCQETLVFNFDSSQYCYRILTLTDLMPVQLQPLTASAPAGLSLGFRFAIRNQGNVAATGGVIVAIRLSTDEVPDPDDWKQELFLTEGIASGDSVYFTGAVLLPTDFLPGPYFLLLQVDPGGDFTEFNEANNSALTSVVVTPPVTAIGALEATQDAYRVSPNPFNQIFTLLCPAASLGRKIQIKLCNSRGKQVFDMEAVAQQNLTVDPGRLPAGVYFLEIQDGQTSSRDILLKY